MKAVIGLVGLAVVLSVSPLAGAADLNGVWKGSFDLNGNSMQTALNLKVTGTEVTGTVEGLPSGSAEIHGGKLDGDNLTFWVNSEYEGANYKVVYTGKVLVDHIDFSFGTDDGSWSSKLTVKRDVAAAVPEPSKAIDLTGVWKGAFNANGTNMTVSFNLKSASNLVTGTMEAVGMAPIEIHDGKIDGSVVTFWLNADYQGQTYQVNYRGTVTGNQIDFSFGLPDGGWNASVTVSK